MLWTAKIGHPQHPGPSHSAGSASSSRFGVNPQPLEHAHTSTACIRVREPSGSGGITLDGYAGDPVAPTRSRLEELEHTQEQCRHARTRAQQGHHPSRADGYAGDPVALTRSRLEELEHTRKQCKHTSTRAQRGHHPSRVRRRSCGPDKEPPGGARAQTQAMQAYKYASPAGASPSRVHERSCGTNMASS